MEEARKHVTFIILQSILNTVCLSQRKHNGALGCLLCLGVLAGGMGWIYCLRGNLKSIFLPVDSSLP